MEDEFHKIIARLRRQYHFMRIERTGLRSALDELKRLHAGNEIDEPNFQELRDLYSSRLSQIEQEMNKYSEIMNDVKKLEEYESEKRRIQIKIVQQIERLEAAVPPKKEMLPPSVAEAAPEEDRLREEILAEIAEVEKEVLAKKKGSERNTDSLRKLNPNLMRE
jgi:archaellum component FlaC